jgi:hypothetical protein
MQSRSRLQGLLRQVALVDRFTKFLALPGNVHLGETNLVLRVFSRQPAQINIELPSRAILNEKAAGIRFCAKMKLKSEIPPKRQ